MSTIRQRVEEIQRRPSGGLITDENRFDYGYVVSIINDMRADVIVNKFKDRGSINDAWLQTYILEYDANIQEDPNCYIDFKCYSPINVSSERDGFEYVGTPDGAFNFPRYGRGGGNTNYSKHRLLSKLDEVTWRYMVDEYGQNTIRVFNNPDIETIMVKELLNNPMDAPNFREDFDDYPVTNDIWQIMKDRIFGTNTSLTLRTYKDNISDSQDTSTVRQP